MKFVAESPGAIRLHPEDGVREVEAGSVDTIAVASNTLLFRGAYLRDGRDLIVQGDGETLIVHDYFAAAHRPKLVAPNGASLSEAVILALARPVDGVEMAQAGGRPASDATVGIGRVQTLSGSATVMRNGVSVALHVGDLVYKGDVVQTGAASSLAIAFLDGTLFSLAASARMVLSEMVYAANGGDNHSLFNLVQGSIHFVAGKIAKTGDMKVGTPLATMGIRGTYVGAEVDANDGTTRVSVIPEPPTPDHPDGHTGAFDVYGGRDAGTLLFRVVDPNAVWTIGPDGSGGVSVRSDPKTPAELAREAQLGQEIFRTLAEAPRLPVFTGPATGGGAGSGNDPNQFGPNPGVPSTGPGNSGPPIPPGPARPEPLPPGPTPQPGPPTDAPPLAAGPSEPAPGLALSPRAVALAQGDVRVGSGAQSLLAGAPDAQLTAVRGPAATQDLPISGAVTLQGRYGVLTLQADGTYTYRAVSAASLGEGQAASDVFALTVVRGSATGATTLRFDVTGKNDAPVVSGPTIGQAGEDGAAVRLSALADASDVDAGTQLQVVDVPSELPAGVTYDAGTRAFRLDPSDAAYQGLAAGEARTVSVRYGVSDGMVTTPATAAWVVTGANDTPVVAGPVTGNAREDGAVMRLSALAQASDIDSGAQLRVVNVPADLPPGVRYDAATQAFGLDPSDPAYQNLGAGQTRTVTVRYGVSDGTATAAASVSWTITGVNDAPVASGPVMGEATEDGVEVRLSALAKISDVDAGAQLRVVDLPSELPPGVRYDADTATFRLDPSDPAYQGLGAGETRTVTVGYGVSDGLATTPAAMAWTVTGVNDAPRVSGPVTGGTGEDGPAIRLSALARASDADAGTQLRVVNVPSELPPGVTYDPATQSFRLDPSGAAYQSLAAGETRTVTVAYDIGDGTATTPATVSWTVSGASDAPTVTGAVTGTATEDGATVRLSALANASDIDAGASLRVVDASSALPPGVRYDAAAQAFELDPSGAAYQSLAAGETRTVTVAYGVGDGTATTAASVSWTVTGTNDAPVLEAATGLSVTERPGQTGGTSLDRAAGQVSLRDPDTRDTHDASVTEALSLLRSSGKPVPEGLASRLAGALVVSVDDASHRVTYGFSAPDGTFDFLAAGETLTARYTLAVDDRNGGAAAVPVVVTVTGTNDLPTIVAASTTASGSLTAPARERLSRDLVNGLGGTAGFGEETLPVNDDQSSGPIDITAVFGESGLDFFGRPYGSLYINNNGNITFAAPSTTFTPQVIDGGADNPIIAAFWADVQTITARGGPTPGGNSQGTNRVYYDLDRTKHTLTVTWDDVGYYNAKIDKLNAFQIQLIGKGNGDFDIVYRYENINWTTGDASTGKVARAGYSAGDGVNYYELPASGDEGRTLALPDTPGNTGFDGVYAFEVRNGRVVSPNLTQTGIIAFADPDRADVHTVESVAYTGPGSALGRLTVDPVTDTTEVGTGGQVAWTYAVDPNTLATGLRPLGAGETKVETFDVVIGDGQGGQATQTVAITLHGVNDAPTVGGDRTLGVTSGGSVALTRDDLWASDPDAAAGPLTYAVGPDADPHGRFTLGEAVVTRFTQADIDAGRVVYHRDGTLAGHASDTIAFTLDDGAGGLAQGSLSVTVTGPYTVQDHVVRASDDAGGDLDIPIEAILFNDRGTRPLDATAITGTGGHPGRIADGTVTVGEEASAQPNGAFTYRAGDAEGRAGNAAPVVVTVATAPDGASVAVGAGQDDEILFASRTSATLLNGNDPGLSAGARAGHDVFVFARDPAGGEGPVHTIADLFADHDAVDLAFLAGSGASAGTIADFVTLRFGESGYDLYARGSTENALRPVAHIDAIRVADAADRPPVHALTVIWNDHLGLVPLPDGGLV